MLTKAETLCSLKSLDGYSLSDYMYCMGGEGGGGGEGGERGREGERGGETPINDFHSIVDILTVDSMCQK